MRCSRLLHLIVALGMGCIAQANVILEWNALMIDAIRLDNSGPTVSSRNLAIFHTAIYDAVNSVTGTHQPYLVQFPLSGEVSAEAAAVGAAHELMPILYPGVVSWSEEKYQAYLADRASDPAVMAGIALGREAARVALESREADGSSTDVPYIPSDLPGAWRRTPPFFRPPVTPQWRYVDLFALPSVAPFLPPPPPPLGSESYAQSFNEVKALGGKNSALRTAEQTEIAIFWSDFSYTSMPPGHWHEIAATIARQRQTSLPDTARLFALLTLAQADASVVCWETKYRHNLWRPVTAIQRAAEDDNALTEPYASWDHLLGAPPFPSYSSGHSTFSKASAQVLSRFYGTDAIFFTASSDSLPGVERSFDSLAACADEIGRSRIYGGIHFEFDNIAGKFSGKLIGEHVSDHWLLPNAALPCVTMQARPGGPMELRIHGVLGSSLITEMSEDLSHWIPISTNLVASGGVSISDAEPAGQMRFYRVMAE